MVIANAMQTLLCSLEIKRDLHYSFWNYVCVCVGLAKIIKFSHYTNDERTQCNERRYRQSRKADFRSFYRYLDDNAAM